MRDLLVFLLLFLLGLAVWTTGLFPAAPAQPAPSIQEKIEQRPATIDRSPAKPSSASDREANPRVDTIASTDAPDARVEVPGSKLSPQRSTSSTGKSDSKDQSENEQTIQRISIPSLKVDARVVEVPFNGETWDISSLGEDIARLGEIPGESAGENIVLAGHFSIPIYKNGPFRYISRLALGDRVLVYTDRMIYTYQVREHAVVGEKDDRVIAHTSEPQLTLLTCETWDEKTGKFLRRRVVFADLIRIEPIGQPPIQ